MPRNSPPIIPWRCRTATVITVFAVLLISSGVCPADRGAWHLKNQPVSLTESAQRAIIGWDGATEVLCLATDVSASMNTKLIEFIPLPARPTVTLGSTDSFDALQRLLARKGVGFFSEKSRSGKERTAGDQSPEPFTIAFHEKLGAHDVTVVRVNSPDEFADWLEEKAGELTGSKAAIPDKLRKLIAKYLNDYGCPWFVFDVIDVGPDPGSVEPIIYKFITTRLFYPLEISSTFHGRTAVDLIVFSEDLCDPGPFLSLGFKISSSARVDANDMEEVLPALADMFDWQALLQVFRYSGPVSALIGNINLGYRRDRLAYTRAEYDRAVLSSFRRGLVFAVYSGICAGIIITLGSLIPLFLAARRQKPRWLPRLLAGFLLGMPLGVILSLAAVFVAERVFALDYSWQFRQHMRSPRMAAWSMGIGFIVFCFQLGLRRRWYLWLLVYVALSLPAAVTTDVEILDDMFRDADSLLEFGRPGLFITYAVIFALLALFAKLLVALTTRTKWAVGFARKRSLPEPAR